MAEVNFSEIRDSLLELFAPVAKGANFETFVLKQLSDTMDGIRRLTCIDENDREYVQVIARDLRLNLEEANSESADSMAAAINIFIFIGIFTQMPIASKNLRDKLRAIIY